MSQSRSRSSPASGWVITRHRSRWNASISSARRSPTSASRAAPPGRVRRRDSRLAPRRVLQGRRTPGDLRSIASTSRRCGHEGPAGDAGRHAARASRRRGASPLRTPTSMRRWPDPTSCRSSSDAGPRAPRASRRSPRTRDRGDLERPGDAHRHVRRPHDPHRAADERHHARAHVDLGHPPAGRRGRRHHGHELQGADLRECPAVLGRHRVHDSRRRSTTLVIARWRGWL